MFRRGPAIVLSLVLSAAALVMAPSAVASDGGTAKDTDPCEKASKVKVKVDDTAARPMAASRPLRKETASMFGTYCRSLTAALTRSRTLSET